MKPFFEVGEEVELASKNQPQENGTYIIEGVMSDRQAQYDARLKGFSGYGECEDEWHYILRGLNVELSSVSGEIKGMFDYAKQSSLRKKHTPGEDFASLMSNLTKETV